MRQYLVIFSLINQYYINDCIANCTDYGIYENEHNIEWIQNNDQIDCNIDTRFIVNSLNHFWESTGFCPSDPHDNSSDYMLSADMHQNLVLISALPHQAIKQIRVHFLLTLISIDSSVDNEIKLNFTLLDKFLQLLYDNDLKPGFEIMGNPSNYFSDFENATQLYEWKDMVRQMVSRYIKMFGYDYVQSWNFESWNEPSIMFRDHYYDNISVTINGFLNYYDACSEALKEATNNDSDSLKFGGPGDHWPKDTKHGPYVIDLIKHCINGTNYFTGNVDDIKLDFISLHEKGNNGKTDYIDQQESKALNDIETEFPQLKYKPFVENEGDPQSGWNRDIWWRSETSYAATVVQVIARRIHEYNFTNPLSLYSFDNGFLSLHPFHFTQRTLLARFQMNNSHPHYVQFVRKPVYAVMGLLAKLGNNVLHVKYSAPSNNYSAFNIIATSFNINNSYNNEGAMDYSVLFVYSLDAVRTEGSSRVNLNINFNENETANSNEWKWSQYSINNQLTNPYQIWLNYNCPSFPSDEIFAKMKEQEEPFIDVNSRHLELINNTWTLSFEIAFPGISLIHICRKSVDIPEKIEKLQAINITTNSVLLKWKSSHIRCVKTYELEYSVTGIESTFSLINNHNIIYASYHYSCNKNESTVGYYRVRAVDFWQRKGSYSDVLKYV